jgi:D-lactate dehydrogenase (cytochrome)
MTPALLAALQTLVGEAHVSVAAADRCEHARDQSSHPASPPDAVVWPGSAAEVAAVLQLATAHATPVTAWGAGTGLEGNAIPAQGGLTLDLRRLNRIVDVHAEDFQVTVQPGVLYKDMNRELARYGLFFAPDPGANASIGGMIANNAAGTRTVRYGATRDNVLALKVALADGTLLRTGSRAVKQSAGYDLTHLFVGSEGTLGVIVEATLKLAPLPEHFSAVTAAFPSVEAAAAAVFGIMGAGLNPAALELLDAAAIRLLIDEGGFDLTAAPNLFMEFHGASEAVLEVELRLVQQICDECEALAFRAGLGREARNRLWEARHGLFETEVRAYPNRQWLVTDVAVPISRYPDIVAFAGRNMTALGLEGTLIGHAGDGNLHTTIFYRPEDAVECANAQVHNARLVEQAIRLGGTCTGEHGVGLGKRQFLEQEHGPEAMALMRLLKATLDPKNILNPGKVV